MLVVLLLLGAAAAQTSPEEQTVLLCGRELAKAHSMYCYGIEPIPPETVEPDSTFPEAGIPVGSVRKIPDRFTFRARRRRSADELLADANLIKACCLTPCHLSELLNHC